MEFNQNDVVVWTGLSKAIGRIEITDGLYSFKNCPVFNNLSTKYLRLATHKEIKLLNNSDIYLF